MYGSEAQERLLGKLDYEFWFLNKLSEYRVFNGGPDATTIRITSDEKKIIIANSSYVDVAAAKVQAITDSLSPLAFIASYKMLDAFVEWILEENKREGKIQEVPRPFKEKGKIFKNRDKLQFPPLFKDYPYLHDCSEALFCRLLPYRNEIVHKNRFRVTNGTLYLSSSQEDTPLTLTLNRIQFGHLVRLIHALVRALGGVLEVNTYTTRLLKYSLDCIKEAHGLETFNQSAPLHVKVELTVPKKDGSFSANMKQVRDELSNCYPSQEVFFNLTVRGVEGESLIAEWHFSSEEVLAEKFLDSDRVSFDDEAYETYRCE